MRVKFKFNLGSIDAAIVGLDFSKCQAGMELEVNDKTHAWLANKNIVDVVLKPVRGVSDAPAIGAVVQPTIKAEPATAKAKQASHKDT